jgi:hypothetical protein
LSCVVDHILQEFNTLFLNRFITYKIATPPQAKTPVKTSFRYWCLYSSFVHGVYCKLGTKSRPLLINVLKKFSCPLLLKLPAAEQVSLLKVLTLKVTFLL